MQSLGSFSTYVTPATPNVNLTQQTVYVSNTRAQTVMSCTQALSFCFNNSISERRSTLRNLESYLQFRFCVCLHVVWRTGATDSDRPTA